MAHTIFLCLGTNMGDRVRHLQDAIDSLPPAVTVVQLSSIYETKPVGYTEQKEFLNQVLKAESGLPPFELLNHVKIIETKMGRTPTFRFGPRPIDLDILFYDDLVLETPKLTIPHPRLPDRAFALVPMVEIAPDWVHPVMQKTVREMLESISQEDVRLFDKPKSLEP